METKYVRVTGKSKQGSAALCSSVVSVGIPGALLLLQPCLGRILAEFPQPYLLIPLRT